MVAAAVAAAATITSSTHHNPNRPPNRNQIFDSSGPDVRVRGNAHQVFDKYQALAREAASSGDRIMAEAYWQYADHYFRMIQTQGGFVQRNNQGWGEGEEGQPTESPAAGRRAVNPSRPTATAHGNGERQGGGRDDQGGRTRAGRSRGTGRRASPASAGSLSSRMDARRRRARSGGGRAARGAGIHAGHGRPAPLKSAPPEFRTTSAAAPALPGVFVADGR